MELLLYVTFGLLSFGGTYGSTTDIQYSVGDFVTCLTENKQMTCRYNSPIFEENEISYNVLPVPSDITDVLQVNVNRYHACALTLSGVKCWGHRGPLGGGLYSGHQLDVPVGLKNPKLVVTSSYTSCALTDEGLVCWGSTGITKPFGSRIPDEVTNGSICARFGEKWECYYRIHYDDHSHVPNLDKGIKQITFGSAHACVLSVKGEVTCWGSNWNGETNVPKLGNPSEISAGYDATCAIDGNEIICWGSRVSRLLRSPKNLKNPRGLNVGYMDACVYTDDGLVCW